MTPALIVDVVLLVLLPLVAGMLAAAALSLELVSQVRVDAMDDDDLRGASRLAQLVEHRTRVMAALRLARLATVVGYVSVLAVIVVDRVGTGWMVAAIAGYSIGTYPIVEIVPRRLAESGPDETARRLSRVSALVYAIAPIRWTSSALEAIVAGIAPADSSAFVVSEDELIALTEEAAAGDEIEDEELEMIESVFALGDTIVREVMVPRTDMVTIESNESISSAVSLALDHGLSRVPVTGSDIDHIVGVSFVKDLTRAERAHRGDEDVKTLMRRARFVPETKHADELLHEMQAGAHHIAIVVDEYGGTSGLVTLEDLIEELVGEIVDEFDTEEPIWETLAGGGVRVHGRMPVDQLNHLIDAELPDGDWDTIGGLIFDSLGRVPAAGASLEAGGVKLVVERMEGRRITRVRVTSPETRPSRLEDEETE